MSDRTRLGDKLAGGISMLPVEFGSIVIDTTEVREVPRPHTYVHGSFDHSGTRFSIYLPPKELYRRRFFHLLQGGVGGSERTATHPSSVIEHLEMCFSLGGYLVESNQGHANDPYVLQDPAILSYRASATVARAAEVIASDFYGARPERGYVYGRSGGGDRAITCVEQCPNLYDGAVAALIPPRNLVYYLSTLCYALCAFGDRVADLRAQAAAASDLEKVFGYCTAAEASALAELLRAGYARDAIDLLGLGVGFELEASIEGLRRHDPSFFSDFWSCSGYAGNEGLPAQMRAVNRVVEIGGFCTAAQLLADPAYSALLLNRSEYERMPGNARVGIFVDGILTGLPVPLDIVPVDEGSSPVAVVRGISRSLLVVGPGKNGLDRLELSSRVYLRNADWLAFAHYFQHEATHVSDLSGRVDGIPIRPQRPFVADSMTWTGIPEHTSTFPGKLILIQGLKDMVVPPLAAAQYVESLDAGDFLDAANVRLWWASNVHHYPPTSRGAAEIDQVGAHIVNDGPLIAHALERLIRWVEYDEAAPRGQRYSTTPSGGIRIVAGSNDIPLGAQPVLELDGPSVVELPDGGGPVEVQFELLCRIGDGWEGILQVEFGLDRVEPWQQLRRAVLGGSEARMPLAASFENSGRTDLVVRASLFPSNSLLSERFSIPCLLRRAVNVVDHGAIGRERAAIFEPSSSRGEARSSE